MTDTVPRSRFEQIHAEIRHLERVHLAGEGQDEINRQLEFLRSLVAPGPRITIAQVKECAPWFLVGVVEYAMQHAAGIIDPANWNDAVARSAKYPLGENRIEDHS